MQNKRYSTANSFHVDLNHSQIHSSKSVIMGFRRRHPMPKAIHFIPTRTPTPLSSPLPSSRPVTSNLAKRSHLRATNKKREPSILKSVNPSQTTHPPTQQFKPTYLHPPQDRTLSQQTKNKTPYQSNPQQWAAAARNPPTTTKTHPDPSKAGLLRHQTAIHQTHIHHSSNSNSNPSRGAKRGSRKASKQLPTWVF